jgi:hypothetical protein
LVCQKAVVIGALNPTEIDVQQREPQDARAAIKREIRVVRATAVDEIAAAFASSALMRTAADRHAPFVTISRDRRVAMAARLAIPTI